MIMTLLGTRPEIIRLSRIMSKLDKTCEHRIIFTGQNYDSRLNDIFWNDLNIRFPDFVIDSKAPSFSEQLSKILIGTEKILDDMKPEKVLMLGDTTSSLTSILCKRKGIKIFHMEAGNRCGNRNMPEEINRYLIDSISDYNIPYTEKSRNNLIDFGIPRNKIMKSGNPIYEVINFYEKEISNSDILSKLEIEFKKYFVATFHRSESVDNPEALKEIIKGLNKISEHFNIKIICSIHPRTRKKLENIDIKINDKLIFCNPFSFFDFIKLEKKSKMILTDSGTCSEEGALFKVPVVIMRNETERPEIVENGLGIVSGIDSENILSCAKLMRERDYNDFKIPDDYADPHVSDKIVNFILGKI